MQKAALYSGCNELTRRDAKQILGEYARTIQWRKDGCDAVMDIGCGPADVTIDIVRPALPAKFKELLGVDISDKMVSYAIECYTKTERINFEVLDIATETLPEHLRGRFDHLTSFYCLHWVQNQRKSVENMYELLSRDGGDCLLVFIVTNFVFDVYEALAELPKWSLYMQDFEQWVSPYHKSVDAGAEYGELLQQAGFVDLNVEVRNDVYTYRGVKFLRDFFKSLCPFYDRIPTSRLQEEFLDDYIECLRHINLHQGMEKGDDFMFMTPYKLMVAYARKPKAESKLERL